MADLRRVAVAAKKPGTELLPDRGPLRFIDADGRPVKPGKSGGAAMPAPERLLEAHRALVVGRRFDRQATSLVKQGRLAVYPSAHGQEASEVGAVLALRDTDWVFPTYRDSVALVTRGIDPVEVLTLLRGDWHCGYDPVAHRTAPQCTPLATQAPHAVGVGHAARLKGEDTVVLAFLGDGATSEGDFHEAMNFAAVFKSPVVFFVQNNQYAISVPLARQTAAPSLAHKAVGYGVPGVGVDGNDVAAVMAAVEQAAERARAGEGPTLIEAHTYRIEAHTNADDATRYRADDEVAAWLRRDPVDRLTAYLREAGLLDDARAAAVAEEAERVAADLRDRIDDQRPPALEELFAHVYAEPTAQLREQAALIAEEV
ncbi:pyruvate dehydrogenase (acetyl-transferring) E1 component subunit alpha [Spirillospora sp. NPDC127200]